MNLSRPMFSLLLFAVVLLLTAPAAKADVVLLKNGDRLSGKIGTYVNNILELETEYAGLLKLPVELIVKINSDTPHEVHLSGGEILQGQLETGADGQLNIGASADRRPMQVVWAQVQSINPPQKRVRWHGTVTLGGTMKSGNTENRDTSFAASGVRKSQQDRISLKLRYNYGEEDDVRTTENTYGAMKYDYFITPKFYTLLSLEFLIDQFKDINLRTLVGPGVGYQVFDDEKKELAFEAGLSYFNEDRDAAEDESWLTGRLEANLSYRLLGWLGFRDELLIYPSLEESGQYQLRNEAAFTSSLSNAWSLNLTHIYEHDSQPPAGVDKSDQAWILGLQYGF